MFVIADAHITSSPELKRMLQLIAELAKYDNVVALGDFIDFTKVSPFELYWHEDWFGIDNFVYVIGNHDIISQELGIQAVEEYISDLGFVYKHGHQYEALLHTNYFVSPEDYIKTFRKLCYSNTVGKFMNKLWRVYTKLKLGKRDRDELSNQLMWLMSRESNVIIGHTHRYMVDYFNSNAIVGGYVDEKKVYYIEESKFDSGDSNSIESFVVQTKEDIIRFCTKKGFC